MYHYIFFDLDGTLTDSKEGILNSLRYAFDKLGEPVPPESTLIKFIGPPLQDSFAEFCGFSAERAAEAIAAFRERDWSKADVIRETMRRLELTEAHKPEILMVGDRKFDVLGAKACGIACAGVEFFGYAAPGELAESGAVAVVRTPEELEQFILTH